MRRMWPLPLLYHLLWLQLQNPSTIGSPFWRRHFDKCRVQTTSLFNSRTSVTSQRRYSHQSSTSRYLKNIMVEAVL